MTDRTIVQVRLPDITEHLGVSLFYTVGKTGFSVWVNQPDSLNIPEYLEEGFALVLNKAVKKLKTMLCASLYASEKTRRRKQAAEEEKKALVEIEALPKEEQEELSRKHLEEKYARTTTGMGILAEEARELKREYISLGGKFGALSYQEGHFGQISEITGPLSGSACYSIKQRTAVAKGLFLLKNQVDKGFNRPLPRNERSGLLKKLRTSNYNRTPLKNRRNILKFDYKFTKEQHCVLAELHAGPGNITGQVSSVESISLDDVRFSPDLWENHDREILFSYELPEEEDDYDSVYSEREPSGDQFSDNEGESN